MKLDSVVDVHATMVRWLTHMDVMHVFEWDLLLMASLRPVKTSPGLSAPKVYSRGPTLITIKMSPLKGTLLCSA